jgi:DNA repair protein RadC
MKVKKWGTSGGPREKLMGKGPGALSDLELIAVLLSTGTANNSILDIAKRILDLAQNSLGEVARLPISDLINIHGIGKAKAVYFKAAIEFARRTQFEAVPEDFKVITSKDAFRVLGPHLGGLAQEEFWMLLLNRRSKVIRKNMISQGGMTSTIADPRVIFRQALYFEASSIIVAHNHPSGNLTPSPADIDLTKKLVAAGRFLEIQLVDHLIISGNNYCSFADSGLL